MSNERDCNRCVYSTRDGNCRKWECNGTVTVKDVKREAVEEYKNSLKGEDNESGD